MKVFFSLLAVFFLHLSLAQASPSEAEAGSNTVQGQSVSHLCPNPKSTLKYSPKPKKIKRYKLRFKRPKVNKLTKITHWSPLRTYKSDKRSWNKRANLVIIISWAITVIGFLSFLLSIIGGTPAMFTFGLIVMMLGGAGMLAGLIWGLTGNRPPK